MQQQNIIMGIIGFIIFSMVFLITDCSTGTIKDQRVEVIEKRWVPAHTEQRMRTRKVGDVTTHYTENVYVPDKYHLILKLEKTGETFTHKVTVGEYEKSEEGQTRWMEFRYGGFTGWRY